MAAIVHYLVAAIILWEACNDWKAPRVQVRTPDRVQTLRLATFAIVETDKFFHRGSVPDEEDRAKTNLSARIDVKHCSTENNFIRV